MAGRYLLNQLAMQWAGLDIRGRTKMAVYPR